MGYTWVLVEYFHVVVRKMVCKILEGHLLPGHVHVLILIPPKLAISTVIGFIKGKNAIYTARDFLGKRRNFVGESFWARGFYVSTVGLDESAVRVYICK